MVLVCCQEEDELTSFRPRQNATMKSSLATARSRVPAEEADEESTAPLSRGAGGAPGAGGFPGMGAGGMPDLASLMSNPAIMNMANQMMQNGGMDQLLNNPASSPVT